MSFREDTEFTKILREFNNKQVMIHDIFLQKKIDEIYQKGNDGKYINRSIKEWMEYINETMSCNRQVEQMAIVMHPDFNNLLAHKLLESKNVYGSTCVEILKRGGLGIDITKKAYERVMALDKKILDKEFNMYKNPFTQEATTLLLIDAIKELETHGKCKTTAQECAFYYTDQDGLIRDFLNSTNSYDVPEKILTFIASNKNIADELRYKAFEIGCDWESLSSATKEIGRQMYPELIAYPFNEEGISTDKTIKENMTRYSIRILEKFVGSNLLSISQLRDLYNQLEDTNPPANSSLGQLLSKILSTTEDTVILRLANEAVETRLNSEEIYTNDLIKNPNYRMTQMFDDLMTKEFDKMCKVGEYDEESVGYLVNGIEKSGINAKLQISIVDKMVEYLNLIKIVIGDENSKDSQRVYDSKLLLSVLLQSANADRMTYSHLLSKNPKNLNFSLIANFGLACHIYQEDNETKNIVDIKKNFFNCISYSDDFDKFFVKVNGKINTDEVNQILKIAKKICRDHPFKHPPQINKLIDELKEEKIKYEKDEPKREMEFIKGKLASLSLKSMTNFYMEINDIYNQYKEIKKDLKEKSKEKLEKEEELQW